MKKIYFFCLLLLSLIIINNQYVQSAQEKPRVSAITSLYKGEEYIEHFLQEITQQTIFDQCELIIINANSPENEEPIILKYAKKFPNIMYIKLNYDPGIYGVWNMGVKLAQADYIANANVDDRLAYDCYEILANELDKYPNIDLVYSDKYITNIPNTSFYDLVGQSYNKLPEFSPRAMLGCLPSAFPLWRKSLHEKYGLFDESFESCGDLDMWLKAVMQGSVFKKVNKPLGVFFDGSKRKNWQSQQRFREELKLNQELYHEMMKHYK